MSAAHRRLPVPWEKETVNKMRTELTSLKQDNEFLKQVSSDYDNMRLDNERLREQVRDGELTLEELGQQLSWSKLQVTTMKVNVSLTYRGS